MRVSGAMGDTRSSNTALGASGASSEKDRAIEMARAVLQDPHIDPCSEIALLARQTLRALQL
jgi:hypothetical protein